MKRIFITALTALLTTTAANAALAQTAAPNNPLRRPAATAAAATEPAAEPATPKARTKARAAKTKSTGDFAERRKRCSGEWAAAKAANSTGGKKWPQFFSACNTRLKSAGV